MYNCIEGTYNRIKDSYNCIKGTYNRIKDTYNYLEMN